MKELKTAQRFEVMYFWNGLLSPVLKIVPFDVLCATPYCGSAAHFTFVDGDTRHYLCKECSDFVREIHAKIYDVKKSNASYPGEK